MRNKIKFLILTYLFTFNLYAFNPAAKFGECDPVYMTPKHTRFILFHSHLYSPSREVKMMYKNSDIPEFSIDLYDNEKLLGRPVITLKKDGIWKDGKKICDGTNKSDFRYSDYHYTEDRQDDDPDGQFCYFTPMKENGWYQYDVAGIRAVKVNDKVAEVYHRPIDYYQKIKDVLQRYYFDYTKTTFKLILPPFKEHMKQLGINLETISKDFQYIYSDKNVDNIYKRILEKKYDPKLFGLEFASTQVKNEVTGKWENVTGIFSTLENKKLFFGNSKEYQYVVGKEVSSEMYDYIKKIISFDSLYVGRYIIDPSYKESITLNYCEGRYFNHELGDPSFQIYGEIKDGKFKIRNFLQ